MLAIKSVIQQRMTQNQETYVAFINLKKAFDKVWNSAIFYLLRKRETRVMKKIGLTDTIVIEDSIRQRKTCLRPRL